MVNHVQVFINMFPELMQPGQHIINIEYNYTCVIPVMEGTFLTQKTLNVYGELHPES